MNKIGIIIGREYWVRVRNRAFIILTLLAPILYSLFIIIPILAASYGSDVKMVDVIDESGLFVGKLESDASATYHFHPGPLEAAKDELLKEDDPDLLLYIPKDVNVYKPEGFALYSEKNISIQTSEMVEGKLDEHLRALRMNALNLRQGVLDTLDAPLELATLKATKEGEEESSSAAATVASYLMGFAMYFFIFMYGGFVMRSVHEEKQNRVVEIIVSSVKPFQLMLGKILAIALVGITQLLIWIILSVVVTTVLGSVFMPDAAQMQTAMEQASTDGGQSAEVFGKVTGMINTLPLGQMALLFAFYFICGYLLYSSLFAAAASAVDSQTDMYQFVFPLSIPIIISIMVLTSVANSPNSSLAFWFSMIPFTSPVIMLARVPFEVELWELLLSLGIMIISVVGAIWLAGRIYRTGILMYGKKINFREVGKWLTYKD